MTTERRGSGNGELEQNRDETFRTAERSLATVRMSQCRRITGRGIGACDSRFSSSELEGKGCTDKPKLVHNELCFQCRKEEDLLLCGQCPRGFLFCMSI